MKSFDLSDTTVLCVDASAVNWDDIARLPLRHGQIIRCRGNPADAVMPIVLSRSNDGYDWIAGAISEDV